MERRYVATPSFGDVAYIESGAGPDALFVHGVFLNADLWGRQVADLSDLRHCIAVDLLAHGDSPCGAGHLSIGVQAAMVLEVLDAMGIERTDLVGNDTGGAVAQVIAATHGDRVSSLALTNGDVHEAFPPEAFRPVHDLACAGLLADQVRELATDPAAIRVALGSSLERPESVPDSTLLGFFGPFASTERAEAVQDYVAGMQPSEMTALRDGLAGFAAPTLVVWGTDDVFFPVQLADWLEATIPGVVRSVRVEGARLFFPLERPDALTRELRSFWDTTCARTRSEDGPER